MLSATSNGISGTRSYRSTLSCLRVPSNTPAQIDSSQPLNWLWCILGSNDLLFWLVIECYIYCNKQRRLCWMAAWVRAKCSAGGPHIRTHIAIHVQLPSREFNLSSWWFTCYRIRSSASTIRTPCLVLRWCSMQYYTNELRQSIEMLACSLFGESRAFMTSKKTLSSMPNEGRVRTR